MTWPGTDGERAAVVSLWGKLDAGAVGAEALRRLLIVYPWTQRYFASFGDLSSDAAIAGNPKVAAHGKVVMGGLDKAVKHIDDIAGAFKSLSTMHSEKLHVDPANFHNFANVISVVVGSKCGSAYTPEVQAAFEKFLEVVVHAL
ncbi:hemoglobin beta-like protein, partial [Neisseria meningitidis]